LFGRYLTELAIAFTAHLKKNGVSVRVHTSTEVITIDHSRSSLSPYRLHVTGGRLMDTRSIVLGMGHVYSPPRSLPSPSIPGYIPLPFPPQPIIEAASKPWIRRALVIGSGLTALDAALTILETLPHVEVGDLNQSLYLCIHCILIHFFVFLFCFLCPCASIGSMCVS
jgi:uncharacterized NAD(P)/FAD-binding protein YdhS